MIHVCLLFFLGYHYNDLENVFSLDENDLLTNADLIIQVGAPKGTSRILQRVGRSNHRIGVPSEAYMVPSNKFEYNTVKFARFRTEIINVKQGRTNFQESGIAI